MLYMEYSMLGMFWSSAHDSMLHATLITRALLLFEIFAIAATSRVIGNGHGEELDSGTDVLGNF